VSSLTKAAQGANPILPFRCRNEWSIKMQYSKLNSRPKWVLAAAAIFLTLAARALYGQVYLNAEMPWHPAVLDAQGKVLAWYHPEKTGVMTNSSDWLGIFWSTRSRTRGTQA
jgi:hypothetical protein